MKNIIFNKFIGLLSSKIKKSEKLDKQQAFDTIRDLHKKNIKSNLINNRQEDLHILPSSIINKLPNINQFQKSKSMKSISSNQSLSPKSQLKDIISKAQNSINRIDKQIKRERDYSPSAINLSTEDFNSRLKETYTKDINTLKQILESGEKSYGETKEEQIDESINERKNYESLLDKLNEYKDRQPWVRNDKEQFKDLIDNIDKLTLIMEGAYNGNRDYSPTNESLNKDNFFNKRKQDLRDSEKYALAQYKKMEEISKSLSWQDYKKPIVLESKTKFDNVTLPRFEKYYQKEVLPLIQPESNIPVIQPELGLDDLERLEYINQLKKSEADRIKYYQDNNIGSFTGSDRPNSTIAEHYRKLLATKDIAKSLGIDSETFDKEIGQYNSSNMTNRTIDFLNSKQIRPVVQPGSNIPVIQPESNIPINNPFNSLDLSNLKKYVITLNNSGDKEPYLYFAGNQWRSLDPLTNPINLELWEKYQSLINPGTLEQKPKVVNKVQPNQPTTEQISELKQLIDRRYKEVKDFTDRGKPHPQLREVLWSYNTLKNLPDSDPLWKDFLNQNRGFIKQIRPVVQPGSNIPVVQQEEFNPLSGLSKIDRLKLYLNDPNIENDPISYREKQQLIKILSTTAEDQIENTIGHLELYMKGTKYDPNFKKQQEKFKEIEKKPNLNDKDTLQQEINRLTALQPTNNRTIIEREKYLKKGQPVPIELQREYEALVELDRQIQELKNQSLINPGAGEQQKDQNSYPVYIPIRGYIQAEKDNLIAYLVKKTRDSQHYEGRIKDIEDIAFLHTTTIPRDIESLVSKHSKTIYIN